MARPTTRSRGIEVDGLEEAMKALKKMSPQLAKEARKDIVEATKPVVVAARRRANYATRTAPSRSTWITHSVTQKGAGIKLRAKAFPTALMTEFGTNWQKVGWKTPNDGETRWRPQWSLEGGRTARPPNPDGWVIQPTIKQMLPETIDAVADAMLKYFSRSFDRAGVPRG